MPYLFSFAGSGIDCDVFWIFRFSIQLKKASKWAGEISIPPKVGNS